MGFFLTIICWLFVLIFIIRFLAYVTILILQLPATASGTENLLQPPPLAYKKWSLGDQEKVSDYVSCGKLCTIWCAMIFGKCGFQPSSCLFLHQFLPSSSQKIESFDVYSTLWFQIGSNQMPSVHVTHFVHVPYSKLIIIIEEHPMKDITCQLLLMFRHHSKYNPKCGKWMDQGMNPKPVVHLRNTIAWFTNFHSYMHACLPACKGKGLML